VAATFQEDRIIVFKDGESEISLQAMNCLGHSPRQPQPQRFHVLAMASVSERGQHQFRRMTLASTDNPLNIDSKKLGWLSIDSDTPRRI